MRGVVDCLKQELSGDVPHCAQAAPAGVGGRGLSPPAPPHAIVESGLKGPLGGARTHAIAHARRRATVQSAHAGTGSTHAYMYSWVSVHSPALCGSAAA